MMFRRLFALLALCCAGFCCAGAGLSDRIPAAADAVVGADLRAILKNPLFAGRQQELSETLMKAGVPEKYAKKPAGCFGSALFCIGIKDKNFFGLVEAPHITLENAASVAGRETRPAEIGTFGTFRYVDLQVEDADPVLLVELKKGLFLLTEKSKLAQNTGVYPKNAELKKLYDSTATNAVLRGAVMTAGVPLPQDPQQADLVPRLQASTFALQLTGEKGTHVILDSKAIASNEQEAAKVQLSIQQLLLMCSVLMGDDPELAQDLIQSVRLSRKGLTVSCRADLPSSLTERLAAYVEKKADERQGMKQPPGVGQPRVGR